MDTLIVPTNYTIVELSGDEDSFFGSVAQGLEQVRRETFCEKMLRQECKNFVQHCDAGVRTIGYQNIQEYMSQIEYCANEYHSPIMGLPEVEGRIISKVFQVNIYVIEKQVSGNMPGGQERQPWLNKIVDETGYRLVERVNYEVPKTIYIIDEGGLNFKPILKKIPEKLLTNTEEIVLQ